MRAGPALAALVLLTACATRPAERMAVLVTSGGEEALADEIRRQLDDSPYLRRGGVSNSLRIGLDEGTEVAGGRQYQYDVEYAIAGTMSGRRIEHAHTRLARRRIRCPADDMERCAGRIIAGAVAQLPKAGRIIAKAPPSTDGFVDSTNSITGVN